MSIMSGLQTIPHVGNIKQVQENIKFQADMITT